MKIAFRIFLLSFLLPLLPALAQSDNSQSTFNSRFSHLTLEDGLSHHETLFVMQDSQGFMWFGTKHGLNKYDGMSVLPYFVVDDSNSLTGNFTHWIHEDNAGALWIATWGDGISRYDTVSDKFTNYFHQKNNPNSIASNNVWSLFVDSKGFVWAATDGGISRLDPKTDKFTHFKHDPDNPNSLSNNTVSRIREDGEGIFWISTYGGGLNRFDPETKLFTHFRHDQGNPKSLSNDNLWGVYIDSSRRIWIASENGLNRFDPKTEIFTSFQHDSNNPLSISSNTVTFIHEDRAGILWLGTFGGGLNRFDTKQKTFKHYRHDPKNIDSLSNDIIMSVYEDTAGALWIATYDGINKLDPEENQFTHYRGDTKSQNDFRDIKVRSIYCDKQRKNTVWVGTDGGLDRLNTSNNNFVHYQHDGNNPDSISGNGIWAIDQDKRGDLWIGTYEAGLNKYNPEKNTFVRYKHSPDSPGSLSNGPIYDLVVDEKRDVLWIASYLSGLDKFDIAGETFTHYSYDAANTDGIVSYWSTAVFVDSRGFVWTGTEAGLSRFDPESEKFTNFRHNNTLDGLSSNMIQTIFEDSHNNIWIGTSNGLSRYKENTNSFERFSEKNGLAGNYVAAIIEDKRGNLWVSTDKGLSKFNYWKKTFRNYDQRDGLQGNSFLIHSAHQNKNGELFFGGLNGFNVFAPSALKDNQHVPKVVFTDFQLFNKPLKAGENSLLTKHISRTKQISLKESQNVFSIEFAALNYRNSSKNQYSYIMEGFDKEYTYKDSNNRLATYTNLSPGRYTFHVKASNNDGIWNQEGASIKIVVITPWWQTNWFKTLTGIFAVFIVLSAFKYVVKLRTEILERRKAEEALQKSDFRFSQMFEQSMTSLSMFSPDGTISEVNQEFCELFGVQEEDVINSDYNAIEGQAIFDAELTSIVKRIFDEKVSASWEIEFDISGISDATKIASSKSGKRFLKAFGYPVLDQDGSLECVVFQHYEITDRKVAETLLRESEEKHRALIENISDLILILDKDGINVWNSSAARQYGIEPEDSIGRPFDEFVHPEDIKKVRELWDEAIANPGKIFISEHRATGTPEDPETWAYQHNTMMYLPDTPGINGAVVVSRNETEQKLAEERYRQTIESSIDGFWIVDTNGMLLNVNDAYCNMIGYSRKELLSMSILDIEALMSDNQIEQRIKIIVKQGSDKFETQHRKKDGVIIDVEVSATYTKRSGGVFFVFLRDITERKASERLLVESEQRFKELFDNSPLSYQAIDDRGNFVEVNETWLNVLGYRKEEVIGRNFADFLSPDGKDDFNTNFPSFKAAGQIIGIEYEMIKKDDSVILVSLHGKVAHTTDGEFKQMHCVFRDITKQKQLEFEKKALEHSLAQSQKLETVGILAGGIAHEFNNLLYMILGTAELMQLDADKEDKDLLQEIIESTQRGADLVKQLMAFSRKSEMNLYPTSLNHEIQRIKKMLDRVLPRMIDIELDLADDLFHIKADQGQLEQVVLNLCLNAKDAMPDGGSLSIKTENSIIDKPFVDTLPGKSMDLKDASCVILTISDTGTGMNKKTMEHIFDPFFTTKEIGSGTGLGLSVIYGIVEGHGGHISCESEPGAGTIFKIYFPAIQDNQTAITANNTKDNLLFKGTETILVVDDEQRILTVMESMFKQWGYTTISANSGESALAIYTQTPKDIDLVVLDLGMPGMGGKKCLEKLIEFDKDVKVIVASGYSDDGSVRDTGEKAKAFILKPFTGNKVIKLIREILDD